MSNSIETEVSRYGDPIFEADQNPQENLHPSRKGTHKIFNRVAAVTFSLSATLTPTIAGAQPNNTEYAQTTETPLVRSQKAQDLALSYAHIARPGLSNLVTPMWYRNTIGEKADTDVINNPDLVTAKDLGNGYIAYDSEGPNGSKGSVITDAEGNVVFKSVIVGPIVEQPLKTLDINSVLSSKDDPIVAAAPEYGDGMMKMTFLDIGLSLVGPSFADWHNANITAVEGFIAPENQNQYKASPWTIADPQPQTSSSDNPTQ